MRTILDKTYKTEAGAEKAIERETAKHGEVESTLTANDDGTFALVITVNDDEPVEVEIPRRPDGSIDTGQTDEELAAEAAENAAIDAAMASAVSESTTPSPTSAAPRRPRSNAILPAVNAAAFAADNPKHRGALRENSKVGQVVAACAGMGARASDLLEIFVKKNGEAWSRAAVDTVLRWDVPAKGYSVQCVEDSAGIDHVYVVRAKGLEVDDLRSVEEHWFGASDGAASASVDA